MWSRGSTWLGQSTTSEIRVFSGFWLWAWTILVTNRSTTAAWSSRSFESSVFATISSILPESQRPPGSNATGLLRPGSQLFPDKGKLRVSHIQRKKLFKSRWLSLIYVTGTAVAWRSRTFPVKPWGCSLKKIRKIQKKSKFLFLGFKIRKPYLRVNNPSISVFTSFFIHKILVHPKKSGKKSEKNPINLKNPKNLENPIKPRIYWTPYLGVNNPSSKTKVWKIDTLNSVWASLYILCTNDWFTENVIQI